MVVSFFLTIATLFLIYMVIVCFRQDHRLWPSCGWHRPHYSLLSPVATLVKKLPYILGWDISGEVVALGEGVTQFAIGDEVYGMPRFPQEAKAYSEYVTAPMSDIALKPKHLTHQKAAGQSTS